jgi:hypothetical protein
MRRPFTSALSGTPPRANPESRSEIPPKELPMPTRRLLIDVSPSRLLIALVVLIVPICIVGLLSLAHAERLLGRTVGSHFKTVAELSGSVVSRFIHDRVTDVGVMAMEFEVLDAAKASSAAGAGRSEAALTASIQEIERQWNTPAGADVANRMLASKASQLLRKHRDFDRRFLRITVTDARGITVAATHKTLDYYQADEDFWQAVHANGRGAVNITDVLYDDVTKAHYIGIGVPIMDESNQFAGVVDALVDVTSIFPVVDRMQFGTSSRIMLVRDDGTVIAAPGVNLAMKMKSEEFAAVHEAVQTITGLQTGYVVADLRGARNVIGFADTGLKQDYGNLGWMVLAAQDTYEAFAPIRMVNRIIAFMSVIGLLAVTLLGVWVFLHRTEEMAHIGAPEELEPRSKPATA